MSSDLCEELIIDIFTRLPTKSLLQFRSVSKSLYARIGSPDFIRLHALRSPEKIMLVHIIRQEEEGLHNTYTLHSEDQFPHNTNIDVTPVACDFGHFSIPGSCNGIVCLYERGKRIILWNPSIRRKVNVHYPPSWGDKCDVYQFGFGFDPIVEDYKILRITKPTSFVYTLKTHTWREITSPTTPFSHVNSFQFPFNGALHCAAKGNLTSSRDGCDYYYYYLLKFDLSSEVFSMIELPEPSWETSVVTIIKGSLAVFASEPQRKNSWIWVMRDPASWSVAFKLELTMNHYDRAGRVFQLTANDHLLLLLSRNRISVYNPETHERSRLVNLDDSSEIVHFVKCIESLGLLDMGTSC